MSHFLREFFMSLGYSRFRQLAEAKRSTARERRQQERLQLMQTQKKKFLLSRGHRGQLTEAAAWWFHGCQSALLVCKCILIELAWLFPSFLF